MRRQQWKSKKLESRSRKLFENFQGEGRRKRTLGILKDFLLQWSYVCAQYSEDRHVNNNVDSGCDYLYNNYDQDHKRQWLWSYIMIINHNNNNDNPDDNDNHDNTHDDESYKLIVTIMITQTITLNRSTFTIRTRVRSPSFPPWSHPHRYAHPPLLTRCNEVEWATLKTVGSAPVGGITKFDLHKWTKWYDPTFRDIQMGNVLC